jgi:uncharacterized protein YcfJ
MHAQFPVTPNYSFTEEFKVNKLMIKKLMTGAVVITMCGVIVSATALADKEPDYAEVINIEEIRETVNTSREVCEDVAVTQKAQPKDEKKIAGTAIGAVAGGVLGSMVGGGKGKTLATVAGAAAGGYAGNKVQGNMQDKKTTTTTERQCHTVTEPQEKVVGYNVTYKIGEKESTVRMKDKPGNRIPLEDGKLKLN